MQKCKGANLGFKKKRGRSCKKRQGEHWKNFCLYFIKGDEIDIRGEGRMTPSPPPPKYTPGFGARMFSFC